MHKYRLTPLNVESKALVVTLLSAALVSAGAVGFTNFGNANAQVSSDVVGIIVDTTQGIQVQNVTSSLPVHHPLDALPMINLSMSDAITAAEEYVGNNSKAVSASLLEGNRSLVYSVILANPADTAYPYICVFYDPGGAEGKKQKMPFECKCKKCTPLGDTWICSDCACVPVTQIP